MTFDQWWESTGAAMFEKNMGYTTAKAAWEASRGDVSRDSIIEECAEAVEGSLKGRQPSAFYATVIRSLKGRDNSPRQD